MGGWSRAGGRIEKRQKRKRKISISVHQWVHGRNYILFNVFGGRKEEKRRLCLLEVFVFRVFRPRSILSRMKSIYILRGGGGYFMFFVLDS